MADDPHPPHRPPTIVVDGDGLLTAPRSGRAAALTAAVEAVRAARPEAHIDVVVTEPAVACLDEPDRAELAALAASGCATVLPAHPLGGADALLLARARERHATLITPRSFAAYVDAHDWLAEPGRVVLPPPPNGSPGPRAVAAPSPPRAVAPPSPPPPPAPPAGGEAAEPAEIPAPPRAARVMAAVGKVLLFAGVLIGLFVVYQLWGTALQTARAQDRLERELDEQLATTTSTAAGPDDPTIAAPSTTVPPTTAPPPVPAAGEPIGRIEIPSIGADWVVVEGVSVEDLKKGPGHYPGSPLPGQPGNVAIAGHRTTYGAPFYDLNALAPGDEIVLTTVQGSFRYLVTAEPFIVRPDQIEVLDPTPGPTLTLTSCHPRYSARERIIVKAALAPEEQPAPAAATTTPPATVPPADGGSNQVLAAGPTSGLGGDPAARLPAFLWGVLTAAVAVGIWLVGRVWRRWPAYLLGAPLFLVVLYFFFENFSRLLPANV